MARSSVRGHCQFVFESAFLQHRETSMSRGWSVVLAGFGINLALGILYTWSVISKAIPATGVGPSNRSRGRSRSVAWCSR